MSNLSFWEILERKNVKVWNFMQKTCFSIQKHQKHPNSKNDLKSRLEALIKKLWAFYVFGHIVTKIQISDDKNMSDFSSRNITLSHFNIFVFKYFNKDGVLVTNMVHKLINGFRLKVMINWNLRFGKFKVAIIGGKWSEKYKYTLLYWRIFHA